MTPANRHLPRAVRRRLSSSAGRLLEELDGARDVTFVPLRGNRGDELIWAGARSLLRGARYREVPPGRLDPDDVRGDLALVAGCGGWCPDFHGFAPQVLEQVTERFDRVVVLPSTFLPTEPVVAQVLSSTPARLYARDRVSQQLAAELGTKHEVEVAHDTAFFFDYRPYVQPGSGTLFAMRTDHAARVDWDRLGIDPADNEDISRTCATMDEWLWCIARVREVHTDRAHVMIAGAMLGRAVTWYPTTDHKVPAIAAYEMDGLDIRSGAST